VFAFLDALQEQAKACAVLLVFAGGHLHRRLFGQMLRRIWLLRVPSG
jgi:hypothetical protein